MTELTSAVPLGVDLRTRAPQHLRRRRWPIAVAAVALIGVWVLMLATWGTRIWFSVALGITGSRVGMLAVLLARARAMEDLARLNEHYHLHLGELPGADEPLLVQHRGEALQVVRVEGRVVVLCAAAEYQPEG